MDMAYIDVTDALEAIEEILQKGDNAFAVAESLAILRRWRSDEMLLVECNRRARQLLARYEPGSRLPASPPPV